MRNIRNLLYRFSSFIKFWSSEKDAENIFQESDYSEENTIDNKYFHLTILPPFQFEPEQKKTCGNESHEKKSTEAVVRRYSSK